jgi:hypothetical protein
MGHDKCEAEEFDYSELFSFFVLLSVEFDEGKVAAYFLPFDDQADEFDRKDHVFEGFLIEIVPHYHKQS